MGIRLNTPSPQPSKDNIAQFQVQEACSFYVFDEGQSLGILMPAHPKFIDAWVPDLNAPGDAEAEWQNPRETGADILSAWKSILDNARSDGYASKLYSGIETALPRVLFDRWTECFPLSPLVSSGSGI